MKKHPPLVSVVIPGFNVGPYLAPALESVLAQTCQDFEVILVDDGSTDDTLDIMRQYAAQDQRLKVFALHSNQGVVTARNVALQEASGQYIAMLDGDDLWTPDALEIRHAAAVSYPEADVIATDFACFTNKLPESSVGQVGLGPRAKQAFASCFASNNPMLIEEPFDLVATTHFAWLGATLVRRTAMSKIGNFAPDFNDYSQDTLLWLRLARNGIFVFSPQITAFYRQRPGSNMAILTAKKPKEQQYLKVLQWIQEKPEFNPHNATICRLTAECHHVCTHYYRHLADTTSAYEHAIRAIKNQPFLWKYWREVIALAVQSFGLFVFHRKS